MIIISDNGRYVCCALSGLISTYGLHFIETGKVLRIAEYVSVASSTIIFYNVYSLNNSSFRPQPARGEQTHPEPVPLSTIAKNMRMITVS
jgi:hypothetical protein